MDKYLHSVLVTLCWPTVFPWTDKPVRLSIIIITIIIIIII